MCFNSLAGLFNSFPSSFLLLQVPVSLQIHPIHNFRGFSSTWSEPTPQFCSVGLLLGAQRPHNAIFSLPWHMRGFSAGGQESKKNSDIWTPVTFPVFKIFCYCNHQLELLYFPPHKSNPSGWMTHLGYSSHVSPAFPWA